MRARAFVLCAVLALWSARAADAVAETYVWKPVAIGAGGFITGLAGDDSGAALLARTDTYGAYRWDARADRWRQLVTADSMPAGDRRQGAMNEGVYEIAVAPSDPSRLYMAVKGFVYRSRDGGASWTRPRAAAPFPARFDANSDFRHYGPFMAVDPADPDHVLIGLPSAGLWRSTDAGERWSRVVGVPQGPDIASSGSDRSPGPLVWFPRTGPHAGEVWALSPGVGVFVSTDHAEAFHPLPAGSGEAPALLKHGAFGPDGAFYGVDARGRRVWRYRGGAWRELTAGLGPRPRAWAAVAVDPKGGEVVVLDEGGVAFASSDGGERWRRLPRRVRVGSGDPPWLHVADKPYFATADVRFDPARAGRLAIAAGTGVYEAQASAGVRRLRIVSRTRGIEQLVANDVVQPPGGAPLFAGWDFGVRRKRDLDAFSTGYGPQERVLIAAQALDWSASDPRFVVTNASDTRIGCCAQDGRAVLAGYSRDGGRSWTRFATLPTPPGARASDPWRMAFGAIAVSAGDTRNIVWEPAFNRAPFYTRDRGRTWRRVRFPGETGPLTGSFGDHTQPRKTLAADRVRSGVFYLYHDGEGANGALRGLWRTADGGGTWTRVHAGAIAPQPALAAKLRAVPGAAGRLFYTPGVRVAGEPPAGDTRLRRSDDGGATWRALDGVDAVDDVGFGRPAPGATAATLFISGRVRGAYGIWRSTDDGASWTRLARFALGRLDQVVVVEGDKDVFGRVYLGYEGSGWVYGGPGPCPVVAGPSPADPRHAETSCEAVAPTDASGAAPEHG